MGLQKSKAKSKARANAKSKRKAKAKFATAAIISFQKLEFLNRLLTVGGVRMAGTPTPLQETGLGSTLRRDAWWEMRLLPVIVLFGGFGLYATLRAFEGAYFEWEAVSLAILFAADRCASSLVSFLPR